MKKYLLIVIYLTLGTQFLIAQEKIIKEDPQLNTINNKEIEKITVKYNQGNQQVPVIEYHENLHKKFVTEAYNLLEYENGSSIFDMEINLDNLRAGAYNEDMSDPVYNIGWPFTTMTHFWNADLGDGHQWNYAGTDYPNAYMKSFKYYYLDCDAPVVGRIERGRQVDYYFQFFDVTNIIDCYNNFEINVTGRLIWNGGVPIYEPITPQPISLYFNYADAWAFRSAIMYSIIGRLCHLLADMAVPAHVNNDQHATDGDFWEHLIVGQSLHGMNYLSAFNEGGILKEIEYTNVPRRYLFYTMNQIADYYPSFDNALNRDGNGDKNYDNWYYDIYTHLDNFFTSSYGNQTVITNFSTFMNRMAEMQIVLLNWGIRTQASLLYWYAIETEQIEPQAPKFGITYTGPVICDNPIQFVCTEHVNSNFKYDFQFATDNNFTNIFKEYYSRTGDFGNVITVSGFERGQTYYCRARALNNSGYSDWSETITFSILPELTVTISGPSWLNYKQRGTYTANVSGGSGNYTYQWYKNGWQPLGTGETQRVSMYNEDITISVEATDGCQIGDVTKYIGYGQAPKTNDITITSTLPKKYKLYNPHPNPFNPNTTISFDLPKESFVHLTVFDISGRKVATLVNEKYPTGNHKVNFEGSNLPSGVYIYKMIAGSYSNIKRMLLIK